MARSGSLGAIPAGAVLRRRRLSSVIYELASRVGRVRKSSIYERQGWAEWVGPNRFARCCASDAYARRSEHAHLPQSRSERRCKIPAYKIFASPNSLTLGIPSAILGGSWRQRAKVAAVAGVVRSLTGVPHCDFGYGIFRLYAVGTRGRSSVGRALECHSRGQGFDSPRLHGVGNEFQVASSAVALGRLPRRSRRGGVPAIGR